MTFLNPLVLLGLVAAAIPLIIHLFNFRKPRRVDFSSLAFLKELQKSTMQRVRIKQWLLLLLRTLALACLVLAFARPTLTEGLAGALGGRARSSVAIIVDNSLSMTLRDAGGAYLDQAKERAAGIVDALEAGDEVFVLTTAGTGEAAPYTTRPGALDALAEIEPMLGSETSAEAIRRAGALLEDAAHLNREVYLVTDAQASTLGDTLAGGLPERARVFLVPVGERTHANVAVTDVRVESRIVEAGQPVRMTATLVNHGREAVEDYVASVYLEGERVGQATADLAPGVPTTVRFTATPQARGWLAGRVATEEDAFGQDNERYFTLHVPERRRLLVVRGEGQPVEYVRLALSPEVAAGRVAFDLATVEEAALPATDLAPYDAVVLLGPRTLSSGETQALSRYVENGGGLFVFPSASAQPADYSALFGALGGGRAEGFSGSLGGEQTVARFDRIDLEHPLFEGVFDRGGRRSTTVESPDVYYALNYVPGGSGEQTLITLSNGRPFLQEIRHGAGVALVAATAPDPAWTDLPVRGLFIPLLYRSAYYLSSGASVEGEQLIVGAPGELRLPGLATDAPLRLVSPLGEVFAPEERGLFGARLLTVDAATRTPGVYDVRAGDALVRRVAFNPDGRESDLTALAPDAAAERLQASIGADVRVLEAGDAAEVAEAVTAGRTGVEMWNVFLALALAFLVAEMLVARQWRPEAAPA